MTKKKITFTAPPSWDLQTASIKNSDYVDYGWTEPLVLLQAPFTAVYNAIYKPNGIYSSDVLWSHHDIDKINRIIEEWNTGKQLCPILFVLSGHQDVTQKGLLLLSGNHRLSVLRAFYEQQNVDFELPFLMKESESNWIVRKIGATIIRVIP